VRSGQLLSALRPRWWGTPHRANQSLFEFWVVATRPLEVNGLGMGAHQARGEVLGILNAFSLLPDPADLLERWLDLCVRHSVCGRPAHDARLVAVMLAHGITHLLTLNPGDFARYPKATCLAPADV
jgi:predicted nucleic acid-binding protein